VIFHTSQHNATKRMPKGEGSYTSSKGGSLIVIEE